MLMLQSQRILHHIIQHQNQRAGHTSHDIGGAPLEKSRHSFLFNDLREGMSRVFVQPLFLWFSALHHHPPPDGVYWVGYCLTEGYHDLGYEELLEEAGFVIH